jgi:hypothetical protein
MSGPIAFCPRCKKDTLFVESGGSSTCSVCGAHFALSDGRLHDPHSVGSEVMGVFQVLFRVALIIAGIVVVGLGVLFAGCAVMFGGMH